MAELPPSLEYLRRNRIKENILAWCDISQTKAHTEDQRDGIEAFTDGGPHRGTKVKSNVIIAGTDRVAIDAVGVAVLRHFGTTANVEKGAVFEQEQLAEGARLGIGISGPNQIELLTDGKESRAYAAEIWKQFA